MVMKKIKICLGLICFLAMLVSITFSCAEEQFTFFNDVHFGDSLDTVREKEPEVEVSTNYSTNQLEYLWEKKQIGKQNASIFYYFDSEEKLSSIVYEITNATQEHWIAYARNEDDGYNGADNEEDFLKL